MEKEILILIVEDEWLSRKYLYSILEDLGYLNIFEAGNAKEALDIVNSNKINLIFMDINIDGHIDGIQCAIKINKSYNIPIIYTTGYTESYIIDEAHDTNIFGYILKPFTKKDIEIQLKLLPKFLNKNKDSKEESHIVKINKDYSFNMKKDSLISKDFIKLSKKETLLLKNLCSSINLTLSYQEIKDRVWVEKDISNSTIRDTILRLRKKLPSVNIQSISGVGYKIIRDDT